MYLTILLTISRLPNIYVIITIFQVLTLLNALPEYSGHGASMENGMKQYYDGSLVHNCLFNLQKK